MDAEPYYVMTLGINRAAPSAVRELSSGLQDKATAKFKLDKQQPT